VANTMPGTRIRPCRGMTNRYCDSAMISKGYHLPREGLRVPGPAYGVRDRARAGREICSAMVPAAG